MSIKLGKDYKIVNGKIIKDERAIEARLDVSTRLKRRSSKKIKVRKKTVDQN